MEYHTGNLPRRGVGPIVVTGAACNGRSLVEAAVLTPEALAKCQPGVRAQRESRECNQQWFEPWKVRQPANPFRVSRFYLIRSPRVVAPLQPLGWN